MSSDVLIFIPFFGSLLYGFFNGVHRAIYLLVALLLSLVVSMLFTVYIERWLLVMAGVEGYPGGAAVAVFILEDRGFYAYFASLVPSIITAAILFVFQVAGIVFARLIPVVGGRVGGRGSDRRGDNAAEFGTMAAWRIAGFLSAVPAGLCASLILALQLLRMPLPVDVLGDNVILSFVNRVAESFIPTLASEI